MIYPLKTTIATLPKSGTHLYKKIISELTTLYNPQLSRLALSCNVTHVTRLDGHFDSSTDISAVAVRDIRGYFYSLCRWCDVRCKSILMEGKEFPGMHSERAETWSKMKFEDKMTALIVGTNESLYKTRYIDSSIYTAISYIHAGVQPIKYENISEMNGQGEPTPLAVFELQKLLRSLGMQFQDEAQLYNLLRRCLFQKTTTYDPNTSLNRNWNQVLEPYVVNLINMKYRALNEELGYS